MNCRILRRRRAHLRAPETAAAAGEFAPSGHAQMAANEKANRPNCAPRSRAQPTPNDWRNWRARPRAWPGQRARDEVEDDGESAMRACSLRPAKLLRLRGQLGGSRFTRHRDLDKCGGTHSAKASTLSATP